MIYIWITDNSIGKVFNVLIKDLGFNLYLHKKTNWCLGLMIKNKYHKSGRCKLKLYEKNYNLYVVKFVVILAFFIKIIILALGAYGIEYRL